MLHITFPIIIGKFDIDGRDEYGRTPLVSNIILEDVRVDNLLSYCIDV